MNSQHNTPNPQWSTCKVTNTQSESDVVICCDKRTGKCTSVTQHAEWLSGCSKPFHHVACSPPFQVEDNQVSHTVLNVLRKEHEPTTQSQQFLNHPGTKKKRDKVNEINHVLHNNRTHKQGFHLFTLMLTRRFSGLMSRWITFFEWQQSRASASCAIYCRTQSTSTTVLYSAIYYK